MKLEIINVVICNEEMPKLRIIRVQHSCLSCRVRLLVPLAWDEGGMKQKRSVGIDAYIFDGKQLRARRLTVTFDAHRFTGLVVFLDDSVDAYATSSPVRQR